MHVATPPPSTAHLALPFFDDAHRAVAEGLVPWAAAQAVDETDDRAACRDWVKRRTACGRLLSFVSSAPAAALSAGGGARRADRCVRAERARGRVRCGRYANHSCQHRFD